MTVRTWVGRFAIVQGQPQEEGPFLRSFLRQRPDEEEDELYVLVQPASTASEEYSSQLADAIGHMYQQDTLSLTGAVSRALKAANQQLREWNERGLRQHRVTASVSCLAVRGRVAYVAQIGPSVAYRLESGSFHSIVPENGITELLGQTEQAEPSFMRFQLSPGDLILIASPRMREFLDEDALRSVLMQGADEALVELFRLARDQQDFSLVLLACTDEPEPEAVPPPKEEPVNDLLRVAEFAQTPEEPELTEPVASAAPGEAADVETQAGPEPAAATMSEGFSEPNIRLKGEEAELHYPRSTGLSANVPSVPPVAALAILILVIVGLLAWCLIPSALEESRDDRFAGLVTQARVALASAEATEDPGQRRKDLRTADLALAEAEVLRPEDPGLAGMRGEVVALQTELDAVLDLPELELIVDASEQLPGGISARQLALGGGGVYFLDREGQRVVVVSLLGLNPEPQVLFAAGDLVGDEQTGAPQHIVWSNELSSLLILDDARRLISVRFGEEPALLTLRDAQAWGSADSIAFADGNFYVLDRQGDQVWRYLPSDSGFDSEREALLASVELEQAAEFAVRDAFYLMMTDGTILRIQGRLIQTLGQEGIDVALVSPASLVSLPDRLLVADRGNKRIVVFSPEGVFRQQLRSPTFTDLQSISIDEDNDLLYILVGETLYRTPLPPTP